MLLLVNSGCDHFMKQKYNSTWEVNSNFHLCSVCLYLWYSIFLYGEWERDRMKKIFCLRHSKHLLQGGSYGSPSKMMDYAYYLNLISRY